jgi:hypothetical protein
MIRCAPAAAAAALAAFALAGCGNTAEYLAMNTGAHAQTAAGGEWRALFDGTDLSHWRGYRRDDLPAGWRIEDGVLAFVPGTSGGDIVTRAKFNDFELELEWRISEGGNSGIFFWSSEEFDHVWQSAPEMQVLDDERHPDARTPAHRAGANYGLHVPSVSAARPAGEWNHVRIVAVANHVEHWLNGEKIVEYEIGSEDWRRRVAASKFIEMPGYGRYRRGHIALQDHGDRVWYRNIRIREL